MPRNTATMSESTACCTGGCRFGFNGMEKDNEIYGTGNAYTAEFRMLDPRLGGRWWSLDPTPKAWESLYSGFSNNPIWFSDPKGNTAGNPQARFEASLGLTFGGNKLTFNAGATASIGQRFNFFQPTLDLSVNVYNGGLGTSGNSSAIQFDISTSAYATFGGGKGIGLPQYTLNFNTKSALNNTFGGSGTYGQILNYNSATNKTTTQGLVGARGGTDQGWTGGIIFSANLGGNLFEGGYQDFTGTHFGSNSQQRTATSLYYDQDPFQQSLNKADTFGRVNGFLFDSYGSGWLQNYIHNSKDLKLFHYD
ncbi:MAG: hypothetical protein ABI199_05720 [Bacteroidia bacterium]